MNAVEPHQNPLPAQSQRESGARGLSSPRAAATLLGVSPSGLRRLAEIYSAVCGELPRDPRTRSRLWPEEALAELSGARDLVLGNRAASIREALESIRRGDNEPAPLDRRANVDPDDEERAELIAELRELRSELGDVRTELAQVRETTSEVLRRLDALAAEAGRTQRSSGEMLGKGDRHRIDPRERELHELRRRLSYLQAELELREI